MGFQWELEYELFGSHSKSVGVAPGLLSTLLSMGLLSITCFPAFAGKLLLVMRISN